MQGHIERGSLVRIEDREGALISVLEGALWITQERDARDYYVKAGERFRIERGGLVLASALRSSSITVTREPAQRTGGRIKALCQRLVRAWAGAYAPSSRPTSAAF
jgi:hypothetical protein